MFTSNRVLKVPEALDRNLNDYIFLHIRVTQEHMNNKILLNSHFVSIIMMIIITTQSAMESGQSLILQNVLLCLQHLATFVLELRIATMTMVALVALSSLHLCSTAAVASVTLT